MIYKNPIIPGYNPDPSCIRVGDDYYLVTSTFEHFPGVPIYHSKNLVNWELIGHCLTKDSQLDLIGTPSSKGIYAATIRYHEGRFYMVTTHTSGLGNFFVYTDDIYGEWSDPIKVDAKGIDPSLFWDDDGKCYFCSNPKGIVAFEIDPNTGEVLSDRHTLTFGTGGRALEAPHMYKKDGMYYLICAEGGTELGHRVTVFRSQNVFGPYESCPNNPILCHQERDLPISATGHADIFEDENGNWWMVFLGYRMLPRLKLQILGRETFLAPMKWEDGWPVVGLGGYALPEMDAPLPKIETVKPVCHDVSYDFDKDSFDKRFTFVRNPERERYIHDKDSRTLTLIGSGTSLDDVNAQPTFAGVRQPDFNILLTAKLDLKNTDAKKAGISIMQTAGYHHDIYVETENGDTYAVFSRTAAFINDKPGRVMLTDCDEAELFIKGDNKYLYFGIMAGDTQITLGKALCASLCSETVVPRSFTGVFLGMFAQYGKAAFKAFDLRVTE